MNTQLLKFGRGNGKLAKEIYTFSLPAGHSCPGALACLAKADRNTGKVTDGANQEFRCFAASMERYRGVRDSRWHNFELLKGKSSVEMRELILASLPKKAGIVRIHVAGDFFSQEYFNAWVMVAQARAETTFYAYTKSINFWLNHLIISSLPENLHLTASEGGRYDVLIKQYGLKTAKVVFSAQEAEVLGLAIDHDDSHAYGSDDSFALLIHGTQAKGSVAAKALAGLRAEGWTGYGKAVAA